MWRGLYTAATGMITEARRTDVISNNLANAATTGYKKDTAVHHEFQNMLIKRFYDKDNGGGAGVPAKELLDTDSGDVTKFKGFNADSQNAPEVGQLGLGSYIAEIAVDYSQGIRYTRNGAFFKNQNGVLQDIRGYNLLDTRGNAITIPANTADSRITVGGDGSIFINGQNQLLAQIQIVQFDNRLAVQKQGDNLFYAVNNAQPQPATGQVMQGLLEKSNVEIVREMVELIHNHRLYEANSKAVTTQDAMLDTSVNQVGRLS